MKYRRVSEIDGSEAGLFVMDVPLLDDADDIGRVMTGFYWGAGAYGAPVGIGGPEFWAEAANASRRT